MYANSVIADLNESIGINPDFCGHHKVIGWKNVLNVGNAAQLILLVLAPTNFSEMGIKLSTVLGRIYADES